MLAPFSVLSVSDHWLFSEDCSVQRFCSSPDGVMVCGNADGREVYAVTHDIIPDKGWVMQFKVINERKMTHRQQKHLIVSCDVCCCCDYMMLIRKCVC